MRRRKRAASERPDRDAAVSAGVEEFVEVEFEDVVARTAAHMQELIERARTDLEQELGPFDVVSEQGQTVVEVAGRPRYRATTTAGGRLLLTDISGRFEPHL